VAIRYPPIVTRPVAEARRGLSENYFYKIMTEQFALQGTSFVENCFKNVKVCSAYSRI
jgi:hypothetical protein